MSGFPEQSLDRFEDEVCALAMIDAVGFVQAGAHALSEPDIVGFAQVESCAVLGLDTEKLAHVRALADCLFAFLEEASETHPRQYSAHIQVQGSEARHGHNLS